MSKDPAVAARLFDSIFDEMMNGTNQVARIIPLHKKDKSKAEIMTKVMNLPPTRKKIIKELLKNLASTEGNNKEVKK